MHRKPRSELSSGIAAIVLLTAVAHTLAHECEQIRDYDDQSAVFLNADNKRPLPLVQVIEKYDPTSMTRIKTKVFAEDDCMVENGRYTCCAIFRVTGMDVRETVCVDFASRNHISSDSNSTVEQFETTLTVGPTHAFMSHQVNIRQGAGDALHNITIPLCIPFLPMFTVCVSIHNTTFDFSTNALRTCFTFDVGLSALPGLNFFSLDLGCLKYENKTIIKDRAGTNNSNTRDSLGGVKLGGVGGEPTRSPFDIALAPPEIEAPDPSSRNVPSQILNHRSSIETNSGGATTLRGIPAAQQARVNWSPTTTERLVGRIQKRNVPKSPDKREYLPERNQLRSRIHGARHLINLYNFDRNWQQQFSVK